MDKDLKQYLARLTDKKLKCNDNVIIAGQKRSQDPNWKKNHQAALAAICASPEWRAKVIANNKAQAADPVWRKKNREANNWIQIPGAASEAAKIPWQNPERHAQHLQQVSERKAKGSYKKTIDHKQAQARTKIRSSIMTAFGEYDSFTAFLEDYPDVNVRDRMRLMPHLYYYTCKGPGKATTEKVHYSPYGYHKYQTVLWECAKEAGCEWALFFKEAKYWFKKMKTLHSDEYYVQIEVKQEWQE